MSGTITTVDIERSIGFIRQPNERRRYFFHRDDLPWHWDWDEQLRERRVEFDGYESINGRGRARNIREARD